MPKQFSDANELFRAVTSNDQLAIKQYYVSIIRKVYAFINKRVINKQDASDIANDCFAKTLQSGVSFSDLDHISKYMFKKADYACLDYLKKKAVPVHVSAETIELYLTSGQRIEEEVIMADFYKLILEQIDSLPVKTDRQIIKSYYLDELDTNEIARLIDRSAQYVRNRKQTILKVLQNELINTIVPFVLLFIMQNNPINFEKKSCLVELPVSFTSLYHISTNH